MPLLRSIASGFRTLFRRERVSQELDEELNGFLEMAAEEKMKQGMRREDALRAVRLERGSLEVSKEVVRSAGWESLVETCWQDLRYGLRMLVKSPGFSAIVIAILTIGIGANTAIFSVVYAVLLKPLPFPHPGQLVFLSEAKPQSGISSAFASYDNFTEIRAQNHVFSELAGITTHELTFTGRGEPAPVDTAGITPELFSLLGTKPLLGRLFIADDGKQGAAPVVVLSETVWRDRFNADVNVIGSSVTLDHRSYTVAGVIPAAPGVPFLPRQIQFWIPVAQDPLFGPLIQQRPDLRGLGVIIGCDCYQFMESPERGVSDTAGRASGASTGIWLKINAISLT